MKDGRFSIACPGGARISHLRQCPIESGKGGERRVSCRHNAFFVCPVKTLFLAPQPFFQERGTPIAVRLALQVLAERAGHQVDLLTYHEGTEAPIPNVRAFRIKAPRWLRNIGPGISARKLLCDAIFTLTVFQMIWRSRHEPYQLIHAVEEAVFVAWLVKVLFGVPYIYDMDSSLAMQVTEKWWPLRPLFPLLQALERLAVRHSLAVVPVCDALAVIANQHGSSEVHVLSDISLLESPPAGDPPSLRREANIPPDHLVALYIGNLEAYQGIDLLLESFSHAAKKHARSELVIIGGTEEHIRHYQDKSATLGIHSRVRFLGPRPVTLLSPYLTQADILLSPRVRGNNTPMKLYSYLHARRALLATALPTHTQVIDSSVAMLANPAPDVFGEALVTLLQDSALRQRLADAAYELAERRYTFAAFRRTLNHIYDRVGQRISEQSTSTTPIPR